MPESIPIEAAARAVVGAIRGCGLTPEAGTVREAMSRNAKRLKVLADNERLGDNNNAFVGGVRLWESPGYPLRLKAKPLKRRRGK